MSISMEAGWKINLKKFDDMTMLLLAAVHKLSDITALGDSCKSTIDMRYLPFEPKRGG